MIIFAFPTRLSLTKALAQAPGCKMGLFVASRYESGELYLKIKTKVKDDLCLIIGDTAPPDENLLKLLMLANTLKQAGAKKIIALVPYLGYSRQEHQIENVARNTYLLGSLLKTAGVHELVTIVLHNPEIQTDFPIKLTSLSARPIFFPTISKMFYKDLTLLAPDEGAIERCHALRTGWPVAYLEKQRLAKVIKLTKLVGQAKSEVVIYDDILNTGETLIKAVDKLKTYNVKKITILVTHGQFFTTNWKKLLRSPVAKIYTTDSCLNAKPHQSKKIKVLSSLPVIRQYLKTISH